MAMCSPQRDERILKAPRMADITLFIYPEIGLENDFRKETSIMSQNSFWSISSIMK